MATRKKKRGGKTRARRTGPVPSRRSTSVVRVHGYTRADGTKVRGYTRVLKSPVVPKKKKRKKRLKSPPKRVETRTRGWIIKHGKRYDRAQKVGRLDADRYASRYGYARTHEFYEWYYGYAPTEAPG